MKHWFTYPLTVHPYEPEFMSRGAIIRVAQAAEAAGFAGMAFTDHPAPAQKWLAAGGHDALDPFVALAIVAAVTDRLRLVPNIVVLPYRNPLLVAKAAASLDVVSDGRFVLSVATGYLRGEYDALGVDFEERNRLFDEALEVVRRVWAADEFSFDGLHFTAVGVNAKPKPTRVPIWIGGNTMLTRRRVATCGDGWNPFMASAALAKGARTVPIEGLDDLVPMLDYLWEQVDLAGRRRDEIDVAFTTGLPPAASPKFDADAHLEKLDRMTSIGVTWNTTWVPGDSVSHALEAIERYGAEVIAKS